MSKLTRYQEIIIRRCSAGERIGLGYFADKPHPANLRWFWLDTGRTIPRRTIETLIERELIEPAKDGLLSGSSQTYQIAPPKPQAA